MVWVRRPIGELSARNSPEQQSRKIGEMDHADVVSALLAAKADPAVEWPDSAADVVPRPTSELNDSFGRRCWVASPSPTTDHCSLSGQGDGAQGGGQDGGASQGSPQRKGGSVIVCCRVSLRFSVCVQLLSACVSVCAVYYTRV